MDPITVNAALTNSMVLFDADRKFQQFDLLQLFGFHGQIIFKLTAATGTRAYTNTVVDSWRILRAFRLFSEREPAMLRGSDSPKRQQWTERLERFARSGKTVAEFCRTEGVSVPSFYHWKGKLAGVDRNNGKPAGDGRRRASAFKRLHVSPSDVSSGVSIRLPDGIVMDLGSDLVTIQKIVAQVLDHQASLGTGSC